MFRTFFLTSLIPFLAVANICSDIPKNNSSIDLESPGNVDGQPNCELRQLALFKLQTSKEPKELNRSLEVLKEQGFFSKLAAELSLKLTTDISLDIELRTFASRVFYLLFYEVTDPRDQLAANSYLLDTKNFYIISSLIKNDPVEQVRIFIIEIFHVYLGPYREINIPNMRTNISAETLRQVELVSELYLPVLIETLKQDLTESTFNIRNEIVVALDRMSASNAMRQTNVLVSLRSWYSIEPDQYLKERFDGHPYLEPYLKSGMLP